MSTTNTRSCPHEDSYMAKIGEADRVWEQLSGAVPGRLLRYLDRLVFVLIKPDAIASGAVHAVIASIEHKGWEILSFRTHNAPHPRTFESLYAYNLTARNEQNQLGMWWLNSRVYTAGASIALMVRITDGDPATEIRAWKGPSNPYRGSAGQIRWDAVGSNTAMNLVHSSDGPISSAREFLLFNDMPALKQVLVKASRRTGPDDQGEPARELMLARPTRRDLDLPSTLIRTRLANPASAMSSAHCTRTAASTSTSTDTFRLGRTHPDPNTCPEVRRESERRGSGTNPSCPHPVGTRRRRMNWCASPVPKQRRSSRRCTRSRTPSKPRSPTVSEPSR